MALAYALEKFAVSDSIVDGQGRAAMSVGADRTAGQTILRRVTVLGAVGLQSLTYAQDCLFIGPVTLATVHEGDAVRYSYFQALSIQERSEKLLREHCEPEKPGLKTDLCLHNLR